MASTRKQFWTSILIAIAAAFAVMAFTGCDYDDDSSVGRDRNALTPRMDVEIHASATKIAVGDTVTLTTETHNMLNENVKLEWVTTGGSMDTEDNNSIARLKFNQPGTYTITVKAMRNDVVIDSDSINIEVRPVR